MKLGVTLGQEALTKLKEIELDYIRAPQKWRVSNLRRIAGVSPLTQSMDSTKVTTVL
ncbi:MAG: hypothetical protein J3T61_02010 [Candidatus Brocadiales bacterium]|nr:hypothetical protein [Candidatus Bathyanammoxibius sp.]